MSEVMLHGVLCMPPELWQDTEIDKKQRYSRYLEASRSIEDLEVALAATKQKLEAAEAKLKELAEQEPVGYKFEVWDGHRRVEVLAIDYTPQHDTVYGLEEIRGKHPLYAKPVPPAALQKLEAAEARLKTAEEQGPIGLVFDCHIDGDETAYWHVHVACTAALQMNAKLYAEPKPAPDLQKRVDELIEQVEQYRFYKRQAETNLSDTKNALVVTRAENTQLKKKLAEQQALINKLRTVLILCHNKVTTTPHLHVVASIEEALERIDSEAEELTTLLSAARAEGVEEGKKMAAVFNVFHKEEFVGSFLQGSFSTRETAQAWIDAQSDGDKFDGELSISEYTLDSLLAAPTHKEE